MNCLFREQLPSDECALAQPHKDYQGGVNIRLSVKDHREETLTLLVEVYDTGIGISREQMPLLFKPFTQLAQSTSRKFAGTGLGLVITRRLVEMMGGAIGVESEVGRGSCFWVSLPLRTAPGEAIPSVYDIRAEAPTGRPLRILVAEDDRMNQLLVRTMLQRVGHVVAVADNGRTALDAVLAAEFDLLLMDMRMPEMDGEQATRAIRALPPPKNRVPVLALTANAMPEHRDRYFASGVNALIAKPVDLETLLGVIERHCG